MGTAENETKSGALPRRLSLSPESLHIWYVKLLGTRKLETALASLLSNDERDRSGSFRYVEDRRRFTFSHGTLRVLLGRYTAVAPRDIVFRYTPTGKPYLSAPRVGVQFNMSHSGDMATYAFSNCCQLGVDIEQIRPMPELLSIAMRFFSPKEYAELVSLEPACRTVAFFNCWTRKEAYLKATGAGLSVSLSSFRVSLRPDQPPTLIRPPSSSLARRRWQVRSLSPSSNHVGAVVFEGRDRALQEWVCAKPEELLWSA